MFRMVIRTLPEGFLELEMVLELLRGGGGGGGGEEFAVVFTTCVQCKNNRLWGFSNEVIYSLLLCYDNIECYKSGTESECLLLGQNCGGTQLSPNSTNPRGQKQPVGTQFASEGDMVC